jgi:hypothetical protein
MTRHKVTEFYTDWVKVCPNITLNFRTTAIFKTSLHKTVIKIKFVGMSMIIYSTKPNI